MKKVVYRGMAGLFVVAVFGLPSGIAAAGRLSLSNGTFRDVIPEARFAGEEGGLRIICPVTLAGSFTSRTIAKVAGARIGSLTTAAVAEASCTGEGRVAFETREFPTEITYESFAGTLPEITELRERVHLPPRITNDYFFFVCRYAPGAGDTMNHLYTRERNGNLVLTTWIWRIPGVAENGVLCPSVLTLEGTIGARSAEGGTIRLTLI